MVEKADYAAWMQREEFSVEQMVALLAGLNPECDLARAYWKTVNDGPAGHHSMKYPGFQAIPRSEQVAQGLYVTAWEEVSRSCTDSEGLLRKVFSRSGNQFIPRRTFIDFARQSGAFAAVMAELARLDLLVEVNWDSARQCSCVGEKKRLRCAAARTILANAEPNSPVFNGSDDDFPRSVNKAALARLVKKRLEIVRCTQTISRGFCGLAQWPDRR